MTLPRLGTIATFEPTDRLAGRLEDGGALILSATVSRTAQRWFVSFTVEEDQELDDQGTVIIIPGPRPLRVGLRQLRRARAVTDQGFGNMRRLLAYKTTWNGGTLVTADRWYPSSKRCSGCGTVKAKLALSERTYRCDNCGLVADRDVNAARNLLHLAASGAESLNARGGTVRPRPARHVPPNLEPGTSTGGTGTAAPRGTAAG